MPSNCSLNHDTFEALLTLPAHFCLLFYLPILLHFTAVYLRLTHLFLRILGGARGGAIKLKAETTVYLDRLSLHHPPISDAFDNIENFFCIKQMIQL